MDRSSREIRLQRVMVTLAGADEVALSLPRDVADIARLLRGFCHHDVARVRGLVQAMIDTPVDHECAEY